MTKANVVTDEQLRDLESAARKILYCIRSIRHSQTVRGPAVLKLRQSGFAGRLVEARKQKEMLQKDLALRAGMSAGQLCMIETGKVVPTITMLQRLAAALDVKPSLLID